MPPRVLASGPKPCGAIIIIYPQTAQTRHLTVDSIDKGVLIDFEGEIPFTDPKCTKINHKI